MSTEPMEAALAALEWGKVVARLSAHASSGPGRDLCAALRPETDLDVIRAALEENRDARRMLVAEGPLPLEGLKEIAPEVEKASKGGSLSPQEIFSVGRTARTAERIRKFFDDRRGKYPRLAHHARTLPPLKDVAEEIEEKVEPSGTIPDRASPALGPFRRHLLQIRARLQKTAEEIVSAPRYARHVQEAYATVRNGRVVIPFRTAAKGLFPGIVHDTSQSGQTVFFEPEELVHLNNEVKLAELEVDREIARILAGLSALVARRGEELLLARGLLSRLDLAQARGLFAEELRAAEPNVTDGRETVLLQARHPLLLLSPSHAEGGGKEVVPNDLRLGKPYLVLVLTGPNAGGKTVALKTLGLLTLMAMAGLSVPASPDSTVSVFTRVFAAVGDEQSVEADLSTYSAHIRRLNEILERADAESLVLLDEVVSGTDPREGAAIARGFLETLADRGVRVLATTHFEELKGIAFEDRRFENGSMDFDAVALRPSYRLRLGVPGRSMGMEIARALGFPPEVLERASRHLAGEGRKIDEILDRLEKDRETLAAEAAAVREKRRELEEERKAQDSDRRRAREEESRALARARARIVEETRKAEGELRAVTEELRKDRKIETVRKAQTVLREWKEKARAAEEDPVVRAAISRTAPVAPEATLHPGRKVYVVSLRRDGEVAAVAGSGDREVEVRAGGLKVRVPREQIRVFPGERREPRAGSAAALGGGEGSDADVYVQTPGNTLDLRGMYVDDALPEVDAFLDRLALVQAPHAFVIHGHGTGALKAAVRRHLRASAYAKRIFPAPQRQGGDGVTIVLMK